MIQEPYGSRISELKGSCRKKQLLFCRKKCHINKKFAEYVTLRKLSFHSIFTYRQIIPQSDLIFKSYEGNTVIFYQILEKIA